MEEWKTCKLCAVIRRRFIYSHHPKQVWQLKKTFFSLPESMSILCLVTAYTLKIFRDILGDVGHSLGSKLGLFARLAKKAKNSKRTSDK